jgi:hypothetical protein
MSAVMVVMAGNARLPVGDKFVFFLQSQTQDQSENNN